MGASDISDTSYLQGHKKRTEVTVKFTGAVLGAPQQEESSNGSGALGSVLGGLLNKKTGNQNQAQSSNGLNVIFTSHTELQAVDTSGLPSSLFEAPAEYSREQ